MNILQPDPHLMLASITVRKTLRGYPLWLAIRQDSVGGRWKVWAHLEFVSLSKSLLFLRKASKISSSCSSSVRLRFKLCGFCIFIARVSPEKMLFLGKFECLRPFSGKLLCSSRLKWSVLEIHPDTTATIFSSPPDLSRYSAQSGKLACICKR